MNEKEQTILEKKECPSCKRVVIIIDNRYSCCGRSINAEKDSLILPLPPSTLAPPQPKLVLPTIPCAYHKCTQLFPKLRQWQKYCSSRCRYLAWFESNFERRVKPKLDKNHGFMSKP